MNTKKWIAVLNLIFQVSSTMLSPIILCLFLGIWLDRRFSTGHTLTLIMLLLGIAASYRNAYILFRNMLRDRDAEKENRENDEQ